MAKRSKPKVRPDAGRKSGLLHMIRAVYERFIRIRGEPPEIALGFALGLFVGMTPTIGVQTPIAVFLAAICKWSKLAAAIGVWISNPLTAPVIYGITYITGAKLMSLDPVFNMPLVPTWSTFKALVQNAPQAFGAMAVGGAIIGLPLALIGYYIAHAAVAKYQQGVREKIARRKARLANAGKKVRKKVLERKLRKAAGGRSLKDNRKKIKTKNN